jgi:hypothetical protein
VKNLGSTTTVIGNCNYTCIASSSISELHGQRLLWLLAAWLIAKLFNLSSRPEFYPGRASEDFADHTLLEQRKSISSVPDPERAQKDNCCHLSDDPVGKDDYKWERNAVGVNEKRNAVGVNEKRNAEVLTKPRPLYRCVDGVQVGVQEIMFRLWTELK